jgi:hypothetical protein
MMVIRKWEEIESSMSPTYQHQWGDGKYNFRYCYIIMQHTYEWTLNFPTGAEEAEVFV